MGLIKKYWGGVRPDIRTYRGLAGILTKMAKHLSLQILWDFGVVCLNYPKVYV